MARPQGKKKQPPKQRQPPAGMRPGGPNNPDPGYTSGPNYVGPDTGAENAGALGGTGIGGEIDLPDITGRGTTEDLTRYGDTGRGTPHTGLTGPRQLSPRSKPATNKKHKPGNQKNAKGNPKRTPGKSARR